MSGWTRVWTRKGLFAALKAAGVAPMLGLLGLVLVLSAGPALADPDPAPGDPGVVAPPGPQAPPPGPLAAPPPADPLAPPPLPNPLAQPVLSGPAEMSRP